MVHVQQLASTVHHIWPISVRNIRILTIFMQQLKTTVAASPFACGLATKFSTINCEVSGERKFLGVEPIFNPKGPYSIASNFFHVSHKCLPHQPFTSTSIASHSFSIAAPAVRNKLSVNSKSATSLGSFKSCVKPELYLMPTLQQLCFFSPR